MGSRALWLWILIGCLAATGTLGVLAFLMPHLPYTQEAIATATLLGAFALTSLGASAAAAKRGNAGLARGSLTVIGFSLVGWLTLIWFESVSPIEEHVDTIARTSGTLTATGVVGLHAALLRLATLRRNLYRWIRLGSIGTACLAALLFSLALWSLIEDVDFWLGRILGSLVICASVGTIVVPILARLESLALAASGDSSLGESPPVELTCPRCGEVQQIIANRPSACRACGLKLRVECEEPRCSCGYLLFGLAEGVCPECGKKLQASEMWRGAVSGATSNQAAPEDGQA